MAGLNSFKEAWASQFEVVRRKLLNRKRRHRQGVECCTAETTKGSILAFLDWKLYSSCVLQISHVMTRHDEPLSFAIPQMMHTKSFHRRYVLSDLFL